MSAHHYQYHSCDAAGQTHTGRMAADSEQEVIAFLQSKRLIPVRIELAAPTPQGTGLSWRKSMGAGDLIEFTNGLCTLVESHVPIDKSLGLLEGLTEKPAAKELIGHLRREVKEGHSLADALQTRPEIFSRMYVNMVHAGEEGGILHHLLPKLAHFLEAAADARRTVLSAMIYPVILALVGVVSVVMLLMFVVPQFASMFEDMGSAVPPSAAFLLAVSAWLKIYWWLLPAIPVAALYGWREWGATSARKLHRDTFILTLPIMGNLTLEAESARFCRTLGSLLSAGIPLLKALVIARGVMENNRLALALEQAEEAVRGGTGLGRALQNAGYFPVLLSQLVIVGEESGRTAEILGKLAESFDVKVKTQTARLVAMLEPLLILGLGLIIGGIVITMLSAIFSINELQT